MKDIYMTCDAFTVCVTINSKGVIIKGPPIVNKFIGQYRSRLKSWMKGFGGFRQHVYSKE